VALQCVGAQKAAADGAAKLTATSNDGLRAPTSAGGAGQATLAASRK
jgi:hypothetical protein